MMTQTNLSFSLRFLLGLAAFGLVLAFMHQASELIVQILLAWIIVLCASPLFNWLLVKNAPKWLTMVVTLLAIFAVFGLLIFVIISANNQLEELLASYTDQAENMQAAVEEFLASLNISQSASESAASLIDPQAILELFANFISDLAEALGNAFLIFMIILFMLLEAFNMPAKIAAEVKTGNEYVERLANFANELRRYVSITTIVALVVGVVDTIFFVIAGIPLPLLWGVLAFLLSYIPIVGFWLAAIPPTILAYFEYGPATAVVVFLGVVIINAFFDEFVLPRYYGKGLDLSPVVVVVSLPLWAAVLGSVGAILSVPISLIFKELMLEADEQNAWLARLMSTEVRVPPAESD